MKRMILVISFLLSGCGTDESADQPAEEGSPMVQVKYIDLETLPTYEADRVELVPACAQACEVLITKDESHYYCEYAGGPWLLIGGSLECILRGN